MNLQFQKFKNKLKNVPRTGWLELGVPEKYVESVYAHIGSTKDMLIELNDEYNLGLDIEKVEKMITIKELVKAYTKEEKSVISGSNSKEVNRNIIIDIFNKYSLPNEFIELYDEFILQETNDAKYVLMASKYESDVQAVDYFEQGFITLEAVLNDIKYYPDELRKKVEELLNKYPSPPLAWLSYDRQYYNGNEIFTKLSDDLFNECINNYMNLKQR